MERISTIHRVTKETDITVTLNLDGTGRADIDTGIGFFDHMLDAFARHGLFDLTVRIEGDLNVDTHHSVEDCGIVLGQAILKALGGKDGIRRYGFFLLPMDESLIECAVDLSGRAYYASDISFPVERIGSFETEVFNEFFYAVAQNALMNLHFHEVRGTNAHHKAEAAFKAFAKALDAASGFDTRIEGVLSTKGSL